MPSRTALIDGTPVRWLEQGSGPPVVPVHGIPTSLVLWRHVLPLLPGLHVLALEMTGLIARDLRTTVRRIEGGKHFTPEDHPDVVAEEIRSLVAEVGA